MRSQSTPYPDRSIIAPALPGWGRLARRLARGWRAYLAGWAALVRSGYVPPGTLPPRPRAAPRAAVPAPPGGPAGPPAGRRVALTGRGVRLGARLGAPLAATSLLFGVVFGAQAGQAGIGVAEAALMSAAVASGTAQMVALQLWAEPLPVVAIVLTTLALNLRYLLLGATLAPWLSGLPPRARYAAAFLLFDENWALAMSRFRAGERDAGVLVGTGAAIFAGWVAGTLAGAGLAGRLPDPRAWGLDFLVTATFLAIVVPLWDGPRRSLLPWGVAGGVALLAAGLLPGAWHVLLGGVAGSVAGGWRDVR